MNLTRTRTETRRGCRGAPAANLLSTSWRSRVAGSVAILVFSSFAAAAQETNELLGTNRFAPPGSLTRTNGNSPAQADSSSRATGSGQGSSTVQTSSRTRLDYLAFRIIPDRNIFNPNRAPRRPFTRTPSAPPKVTQTFSLLGTMSYEKGAIAFFDGSSYEYRKALKPGDAIAGYKVADIALNSVKLTSGTNEVELPVGREMRREDQGQWLLAGRATSAAMASTGGDPRRDRGDRGSRGSFRPPDRFSFRNR